MLTVEYREPYADNTDDWGYDFRGNQPHRRNFRLVLTPESKAVMMTKPTVEEWIEKNIQCLEDNPDIHNYWTMSGDTLVLVSREDDAYEVVIATPRMTGWAVEQA